MKPLLAIFLFLSISASAQQESAYYTKLIKYRKHRIGLSVDAGGSFLRPGYHAGLSANLETYYCFDLGERWMLEPAVGVSLVTLRTHTNFSAHTYRDSTAGVNSLSIPLRVRYVIPEWNVAPFIAVSYEQRLVTNVIIDTVYEGPNGAWVSEKKYNDERGTRINNTQLHIGVCYFSPNRRAALGFVYRRNLFDWAKGDFPEAFAWQLGLRVEITFGLS